SGTYKTIQDWAKTIGAFLAAPLKQLGAWIRRLLAKDAADSGKSTAGKILISAAWLFAFLVLCVVVNERGHAGKTVIQPFGNPDKDDQRLDPGRHLSELLANRIAEIRDEVPEFIAIPEHTSGGGDKPQFRPLALSAGEDLSTAVAGANELDLFGVKIPLGSVLSLLQRPVRAAFNVEAISGSLFTADTKDHTRWTAVASTERGQSWRVSVEVPKTQEPANSQADDDKGAKGAAQGSKKEQVVKKKPPDPGTGSNDDDSRYDCTKSLDDSDQSPLEQLALLLAFRIERADTGSGVSSSFKAFQDF